MRILIFYISKGSKNIFRESPIVAVVMEWEHFGSNGGKLGSLVCSDEKVEELVIFMLSNGLMPFKLAPEENMIIRLDTSNHGKDWKFDKNDNVVIWLYQPSFPSDFSNSDMIMLNNGEVHVFS